MKLFRVDGPLYQFFSRFWDMIKLNFLWLLCSLPIVTIGASTVAAYTITLKMVDEQEGYIAKSFFKAFRANLKQGIPLGLLTLLATYIVYLDIQIFMALENPPVYILVMTIVSIFVFTLGLIYAFPLSARYENTLINTLKNSWEISLRYFGRTVILVLVLAVEFVIFFFNHFTIAMFVLIGPACFMLTISGMVMYMFRQIEKDPDSVRR
ncbi:MAG: DUF624 domain-containing protein [Lachnospiraceae bacterium]|nr:DUF624 domain-containing protein [Lachnospiraceae bacterium]